MIKVQIHCPHCGELIDVTAYSKVIACRNCGTMVGMDTSTNNSSMSRLEVRKRRDCPVCRGYGSMIRNLKRTLWKCTECGYSISPKELRKTTFWFCDNCDTFMNVQPGFSEADGTWKCTVCGFTNDISDENIF